MKAKIYKPCINQMQSGKNNSKLWILEYLKIVKNTVNPIMNWYSSSDTMQEVKIKFPTKEAAESFAKKEKIDYELIIPNEAKLQKRLYSDNFK